MKPIAETLKNPPTDIDPPVALRLVPFITPWSTRELVNILVEPMVNSNDYLLKVYELCANSLPRSVPVATLRKILLPIKMNADMRESLAAFPKSFFVLREDLTSAYNYFIDDVVGRENADRSLMMEWHPSVYLYEDLIADCPRELLLDLAPDRQRERKTATRKRNWLIYQKSLDVLAEHRSKTPILRLSKGRLARRTWKELSESGEIKNLPSPETIAKIIREEEKSAKK